MDDIETKKWVHGSAKHNAWLAYVDGATVHPKGRRITVTTEVILQEAIDYVNALDWRFLDE